MKVTIYNTTEKLPVGTIVRNLKVENQYEYWFIPGLSVVLEVIPGGSRYESCYVLEVENPPQEITSYKEWRAIRKSSPQTQTSGKAVAFTTRQIGSGEFIPDRKDFFFTWKSEVRKELAEVLASCTEPDNCGYYSTARILEVLAERDFVKFIADAEAATGRVGMSLTQACAWRCQN